MHITFRLSDTALEHLSGPMRLLSLNRHGGLAWEEFRQQEMPPYATLSHTWELRKQGSPSQDCVLRWTSGSWRGGAAKPAQRLLCLSASVALPSSDARTAHQHDGASYTTAPRLVVSRRSLAVQSAP